MSALNFEFDANRLQDLARTQREAFAHAEPFPHAVIENFLPESWLEPLLAEFPKPQAAQWQAFDNADEKKKLAASRAAGMGSVTRQVLGQFNSAVFLEFLETLTGIQGLIPDPYFIGGGLHQTERGGFLKIHADFNWHEQLCLDRRLNFIVYLNRGWQEAYGGDLQLWDVDMTHCVKTVYPMFNRAVVFYTFDKGYHGHPDPLNCPPDETRKSLALFYYTNGRPAGESFEIHSSRFRARPGEELQLTRPARTWKSVAKQFIPPIVIDAMRGRNK